MKREVRSLAVALLCLLCAAAPVAAGGDNLDGMYARIWKPGLKAVINVRGNGQGASISAAIRGLAEGRAYRIIGTNASGDCSSPVTAGNRTIVDYIDEDVVSSSGTFHIGTASGGVWKSTKFIRIREVGGAAAACVGTYQYSVGPNIVSRDGAYSRFVDGGDLKALVLVQQLANGSERVSVAAGDINGDNVDILVRGAGAACGVVPTGTVRFAFQLNDVGPTAFASRTVEMTQDELDTLKSIRITPLTGQQGQDWFGACRKSILIALLVP